ncbi:MAG: hypothetical protein ACU843_13720 [Gammaproteobacteria bacterium]
MEKLPAPEEIFGSQGPTPEDRDYQGSRYAEVKSALFANPYQQVWGAPGESPLPTYHTTNRSVWAGSLPGGRPGQFDQACIRTLDFGGDLRWGEDRKGFRRLFRPEGVCATGTWEIDADNAYSGYFEKGSKGLLILRLTGAVHPTLRGPRRSYGVALKLYPTTDENHEQPLKTANVFLSDDLGGSTANRITEVELTSAPNLSGLNRGRLIPTLLKEAITFVVHDRQPFLRQVYPIAELGKPADKPTRSPEYMRLKASAGHPIVDEDDCRNEVLGQIFDKGNPIPQRTLCFDIAVSDTGKSSGFVFFPKGRRQTITDWQTIGKVTLTNAVASYNGDFVINFPHPTWRDDKNDPNTATRQNGKKVRWF